MKRATLKGAFIMPRKQKYGPDYLKTYLDLHIDEGISIRRLRQDYDMEISPTQFRHYVRRYREYGEAALYPKGRNNFYSEDFKLRVVEEHLEKGATATSLALKYDIPSRSTVSSWIIKYTKGEQVKTHSPSPEVYNMATRRTTYEERVKIVETFFNKQMSYKEAASAFQIPYQTIYRWVQKYKKHGSAGLVDGRGRGKPDKVQTAEERLKVENLALKRRNKYLEMEVKALKKAKQIERELMSTKYDKKQNI